MDKAFTLAIGISMVILPALSLTAVTFDWDYGQPAADGTAPSGYWIQLYLTLYEIEVIDCLAVTDGTFLITYFGLALYNLYLVNQKDDPRYTDWNEWKNKTICGCCKYCYEVMIICICGPLVVIFFMILFEFAESGFFSIYDNVNAGLLCIWAFIVKIIMGIRWIQIAKSSNYSTWKRNCEIMNQGRGSNINNGQAYQMAPLQDPDQDLENGVNL